MNAMRNETPEPNDFGELSQRGQCLETSEKRSSETTIAERVCALRAQIDAAARAAGRDPAEVTLVAVSKTQPAKALRAAYAAGQRVFGESYVQEALAKQAELADCAIEWHFIGPIQRNKTRAIAEHFDWVHSLDRLVIAERLSVQRPATRPPLKVFIEVNLSAEASKAGVSPEQAPALAQRIAELPRLELVGLMTIPEPGLDEAAARARFGQLRALREALRAAGLPLWALSMGMSADWRWAIEEGATHVRLGTALFGERPAARRCGLSIV